MTKQVTRYSPFDEMDRMLDTMRGMMMGRYGWPERQAGDNLALNVSEDEDSLRIDAVLPGMTEDDIELRIEGDTLTLSAESSVEREDEGRTWHVVERRYGALRRSITLPAEVNTDQAEAELENGILTVTLPKEQPGPLKKIAVKAKKAIGSGKNDS